MFDIGVKFKIDYLKLENEILLELKTRVGNNLNKIIPIIQKECVDIFDSVFTYHPTYANLQDGILRTDFGLVDPQQTLDAISNILKSRIFCRRNSLSIHGAKLSAGIVVGLNISNMNDIVQTETLAGAPEPWLEWLLFYGDDIVISDYDVTYHANPIYSRTNSGIMTKSKRGFRVRSQSSGTVNDNFITQVLLSLEKEFNIIIEKRLKGVFD